eukprot:808281-Rhodomonas_salina.2
MSGPGRRGKARAGSRGVRTRPAVSCSAIIASMKPVPRVDCTKERALGASSLPDLPCSRLRTWCGRTSAKPPCFSTGPR